MLRSLSKEALFKQCADQDEEIIRCGRSARVDPETLPRQCRDVEQMTSRTEDEEQQEVGSRPRRQRRGAASNWPNQRLKEIQS